MSTPKTEVHGRRRVWRWVKRGTLGFLGFLVLAVATVLVTIHTDWGRERIRRIVEAQLDNTFVGGATIGRLEGSPFGELVARDVVINGPDHQPAITVKTLRLEVSLLPLLDKWAKLDSVTLEDLDVLLKRDPDGTLQISRLVKPGPKSGWSVEIPDLEIHRGHVWLDTGAGEEPINLDKLQLAAALKMPFEEPIDATLDLTGTWRERATDIDLETVLTSGEGLVKVERLALAVGEITVNAEGVRVETRPGEQLPSVIEGKVAINAPKAEVERIVREVELPEDVQLQLTAHKVESQPWTHIVVDGLLGRQRITANIDADLVAQRAKGTLATGRLDLTKLTDGKLVGQAETTITFDATAPQPGALPVGTAQIAIAGDFEGAPDATVDITASSTGDAGKATVKLDGRAVTANIDAEVKKLGDAFRLENARIIAKTTSPSKATGGKAPVHGTFDIDLTASGALTPKPDLAVAGRIDGRGLRASDVRVGSLKLAIDARQLPSAPLGRVELEARNLRRGDMYVRELDLRAANREDGKIQVSLRTRPRPNPWLVEADALVDPRARVSAAGNTITIQLQRHHVRAGHGKNWKGSSGFITIAPDRIELGDFTSETDGGKLAVAGVMYRSGRRQGDVVAKVDLDSFQLANLHEAYRGTVNAKVDLARTNGKLAGTAHLEASGLALDPRTLTYDVEAKVEATADRLIVGLEAGSLQLGKALVDIDIDAPKDITNAAQWRTLGRSAIREARLRLQDLDVKQIARLAKQPGEDMYAGKINGDIQVSATTTGGVIRVRDLDAPAIRELRGVDADLHIAQSSPDLITPTLVARIADVGAVAAQATLHLPDRVFDPAAWKAKGRGAVHGISVRANDIEIAPGLLDRFQIKSAIRGKISVIAEVSESIKSARLAVEMRDMRGSPVNQPVDININASIDDKATLASIVAISQNTKLLEVQGRVPVTLAQIEADPSLVQAAPLQITARLPDVPAPRLMAVFGRSEVTSGTLTGTVEVGGTVGAPTVRARIAGTNLGVPPGPRGRPVKHIERITLDALWDGARGKVTIDGTQPRGSLSVTAEGDPKQLEKAVVSLKAKDFDLQPLLAFAPGPAGGASGTLDADMNMRGLDPRSAKLAGELHLFDARVPIAPQVGTLRRAKIDVVARDSGVTVGVDGRLGPGSIKGGGTIALQGAVPTAGDMKFTLRKVSPIGVVEPIIDADVETKLRNDGDKWVADIAIRNGVVKIPSDRGEQLDPVGAPPDMRFMDGSRITRRPMEDQPPAVPLFVANIRIYSTYIESKEMRGLVKGKLTISSDGEAVGIVGAIDASDRAELELFGRRYLVERAGVRFDGSTDPLLDIRISYDFPEVTTITEVRGRASDPELRMSSTPGTYSQGQLLGFLLGGEPNGDPQATSFRDAATSAGASFVANKIGGYVKGALPIDVDVLKYESATASSSAAIKVGTWLTRSLFVAYRRRLDARPDENTGEGQIEYWMTRRIMLEAVIGNRGVSGADILWRRRY